MHLGEDTPDAIAQAAGILRRGGLVAFPTETVYGLGADARNPEAVARVFRAKGRPADHPLIVHLADSGEIAQWAREVPAVAWQLAERFWPGPLTLILKRSPDVPAAVTGGQDTVGLRVPNHPVALALLRAFGGGIAAPSANRFGRVSPTSAAHVIAEFGDAVEWVIDGGSCRVGLESTILDLSGEQPRMLRPGAVTSEALAAILGAPPAMRSIGSPRAPGCLPSHYAPDTPLRLVETGSIEPTVRALVASGHTVAVLSRQPPASADSTSRCRWARMPANADEYGHVLYARLREIDAWGCRCIVVESPPATSAWNAARDRLWRAAGAAPEPTDGT